MSKHRLTSDDMVYRTGQVFFDFTGRLWRTPTRSADGRLAASEMIHDSGMTGMSKHYLTPERLMSGSPFYALDGQLRGDKRVLDSTLRVINRDMSLWEGTKLDVTTVVYPYVG